jgi:hypothetical protein
MAVLLKCTNAGHEKQFLLRAGQTVRVGSSEWMEFSIPESPQLSDHHFTISYTKEPHLHTNADCLITADEKPVSELTLSHRSKFNVGDCTFETLFVGHQWVSSQEKAREGATGSPRSAKQVPQPITTIDQAKPVWQSKPELAAIGIPTTVLQKLATIECPATAALTLLDEGQASLAMRLIAALLPTVDCIHWTMHCLLGGVEADKDPNLQALSVWIQSPSEARRAQVAAKLDDSPRLPIEWLFQAIAWTGGSLAGPETAIVVPPAHLPATACAVAIQLCAAERQGNDTLKGFFHLARPYLAVF